MFLLGLLFVFVASGISLLWIYTGGHLDQRSIERALPLITRDVDATFHHLGKKAEEIYMESARTLGPYAREAAASGLAAWNMAAERGRATAEWIGEKLGPAGAAAAESAARAWSTAQTRVATGWEWLKPRVWEWWLAARPYFQWLGECIIEQTRAVYLWAEKNLPVYYDLAAEKTGQVVEAVKAWVK